MKKICALLILALAFGSSLAIASESGQRKAAEELLDIMNLKEMLQRSAEQMVNMQLQRNPNMVPFKNIMLQFFEKHMGYSVIKPEMAGIYAEAFTEDELKEIIAFYRSPVGQKALETVPQLLNKGAKLGMQRVQSNMPELQAMIKEEAERLQSLQELQDMQQKDKE